MSILTGISGGIGAGKSVVCRVLRTLGYAVYDSDSRAKALMDADPDIKQRIEREIAPQAIVDGAICRPVLADIVFADKEKLRILNSIVHNAVRNDLEKWRQSSDDPHLFVECAILHSSGLINVVDNEWRVTAPQDIRVERVCKRNNLTPAQVLDRIASQTADENGIDANVPLTILVNDDRTPLLRQILAALDNTNN